MTDTATLHIIYDGPALADHEMDVQDLSPALMAFGELVEEANRIINGEEAHVSVRVRGSFETGSFGIETVVDQTFLSTVKDFFGGPNIQSAWDLLKALAIVEGASGGAVSKTTKVAYYGLLYLLRWLKGTRPDEVEVLSNEEGTVRVFKDNGHIDVEWEVLELYRSYKVRDALDRVIRKPLEKEGVTSFATADAQRRYIYTKVEEDERYWFAGFEPEEEFIDEKTFDLTLQLISPDFSEGNKWRVYDGNNTLYVSIEDEAFKHRVQSGEESFRKDDILRATVRRREWRTKTGLKAEHVLEQIHEHRHAEQQMNLNIKRPGDKNPS